MFAELEELEAKEKEVELIEKYKSFDKEYGYNCTKGGDGTVGLKKTKEQIECLKELLSKPVYQRKLDGTFIKKWNSVREISRETQYSRSNITQCCKCKTYQAYGFLWSFDESYIAKQKEREHKTVYQYDLDGNLIKRWESLIKIEEKLGYYQTNISHCCIGKSPSAYGYIWSYEKRNDIVYKNKNIQRQKKVYQFSKDMKLIAEWDNLGTVESILGYNRSSISNCCNCKIKTAYGYVWRYEDTIDNKISLTSAQAKKVIQMDKQYNIVNKYNSLSDAQKVTNLGNISECCNGRRKTAGGYIWVYEEDYNKFDKNKHMKECNHIKEVN